MSRFTYFLKMNANSLDTLSKAGGNVDLNIENMPDVAEGVVDQLGLKFDDEGQEALDLIVEKYESLEANLNKLATMKSGYIKDMADGAQKFLSKKILNFYTDLSKLLDTNDGIISSNLFKIYGFIDTVKVVIDGALDLTDAILKVSYKHNNSDEQDPIELNTTVGTNPNQIASETASDNLVNSAQGQEMPGEHPDNLPYNVVLDEESK